MQNCLIRKNEMEVSGCRGTFKGHLDDLLSERDLRKGLPPTGLSYAEFIGMRGRTLSFTSFRTSKWSTMFPTWKNT